VVPGGFPRSVRHARSSSAPLLGAVLAAGLLAGCGGGDLVLPNNGGAAAIHVVNGDGQSGTVGELLASPIVVQVTDAAGDPVPGATVEFALTSAGDGAEIVPATATTDQQGLAQTRVLLGAKVGLQTGEARLSVEGPNPPKASFTAVASAGASGNQPPAAEFDVDCQQLTCAFSDRSTDADGGVVAWAWDFGDGAISTDRNPSHPYAVEGTYQVRLTVSDGGGAQDTKVHDAHPQAPPPVTNEPPHADFDMHCEKLACAFTDKSKDDDGAIVARAWSFGDGATSTEANPEHTYAARGHYDVVLTVTDDLGATASKTRTVDAKE